MTIRVFLNGHDEDEKGTVGVFLWNHGQADISVKCQFITEVFAWEFGYAEAVKAGHGFGLSKFLTYAKCAEAYKDKDFVVTANVEIPGEPVKIFVAPKKQKLNVFEKVYNSMEESDFALVFEKEEVPCHKIVLAAASPVFKAMVKNKHREAIEGKANIVFTNEVGRAFVRFIYTGEVEECLLKEHALAFLAMGEMYDLQELKEMAATELLIQLDKENMVAMISLGDLFRAENVFEAALKMTKANMNWLQSQDGGMEELKKLSKDTMAR